MGDYKKLGKNITLLAIGNFGSKLINFFLVPLYTYVLTTNEYGVADLIFTLCSLALPFFSGMIYSALMRYSLDKNANYQQLFTGSAVIILCGFLVFLVFSPIALLSRQLRPYIILFVLYYLTSVIHETLLYFARGINNVREYAIATIINTLSVVIFNILFLLGFNMRINGYLLAYVLALAVSSLYLFVRLKIWRFLISIRKVDWDITKEMLRYSIPLIPNSLSWWIANSSDKFIIIFFHGIALSGLYAISYKIPSILSIISNIFFSAWTISSVDGFGTEESKVYFSDVYEKYTMVQCIISSGVILSCQILAKVLYQSGFYEAWRYVPILCIAVMFHALGAFYGSIYAVAKQTSGAAISTGVGAVTNIIFNFLLIPHLYAYGAAIATLISYIVVFAVRAVHTKKYLNFKVNVTGNLICYFLLLIQAVIAIAQIQYYYLFELISFILICILKKKSILWFINIFIKYSIKILKQKAYKR